LLLLQAFLGNNYTLKLLIALSLLAIIVSLVANKQKTYNGIIIGAKMFLKLLPTLINVLILVSIFLYLIPNDKLVQWMGENSGVEGFAIAGVTGSLSLIPGFIAFPLSSVLIKSGVSYPVLAMFITTLLMVGIFTLPIEKEFFGWRVSLIRNGLSLIGAVVCALLIGLFY
jgi:uncharacterized membrane protein YraQ (UPF0718 family)